MAAIPVKYEPPMLAQFCQYINTARVWINSGASVISGAAWARTTETFARKQSSHKHALTVWLDVMVNSWPSRFLLEMVSTVVITHYSSIITYIVRLCNGILNGEGDHWNVSRNKETTYKYFHWNEQEKVTPNLIFHMCRFKCLARTHVSAWGRASIKEDMN